MTTAVTAVGSQPGRARLALALMVTAQFMVILDSSIVNVALPTIQRALGFSALGVEGVITAYATAFGGALILGGRLADLFGRRRIFMAGLLGFGLASLACALATSPTFLVTARAAQGLTAALLAPAALALLTTTFTEGADRNRALGIFGSATATGFVAGQILGGTLTDLVGWRSIFLINLPVAVVGSVLATRVLGSDGPVRDRRIPDLLGAVLITASMALLVWAPAAGARQGWTSATFLLPLGAGLVLLGLFFAVEGRARNPLVRLSMLRSRWLAGTYVVTAVTGMLNGAVILLCTLFLQQVHEYSPLRAGLAFVPTGVAGLIVATRYASRMISRFGVRAVLGGASLLSAVAVAGVSPLSGGGDYLPLLPWLVAIGATFTTAAVATTVAISTGVAPNEQGMAAALRQTAFQVGVALGVAILLSVAASHTTALLAVAPRPTRAEALTGGFSLSLAILAALSALGGITALTVLTRRTSPG